MAKTLQIFRENGATTIEEAHAIMANAILEQWLAEAPTVWKREYDDGNEACFEYWVEDEHSPGYPAPSGTHQAKLVAIEEIK